MKAAVAIAVAGGRILPFGDLEIAAPWLFNQRA